MKRHVSADQVRGRKTRVREREERRRSLQGKGDLKELKARQAAVASAKGACDGSKLARRNRIAQASALLAQFHHVDSCNCGFLFEGAVLRVDASCVCWTAGLQGAQRQPLVRPARPWGRDAREVPASPDPVVSR